MPKKKEEEEGDLTIAAPLALPVDLLGVGH